MKRFLSFLALCFFSCSCLFAQTSVKYVISNDSTCIYWLDDDINMSNTLYLNSQLRNSKLNIDTLFAKEIKSKTNTNNKIERIIPNYVLLLNTSLLMDSLSLSDSIANLPLSALIKNFQEQGDSSKLITFGSEGFEKYFYLTSSSDFNWDICSSLSTNNYSQPNINKDNSYPNYLVYILFVVSFVFLVLCILLSVFLINCKKMTNINLDKQKSYFEKKMSELSKKSAISIPKSDNVLVKENNFLNNKVNELNEKFDILKDKSQDIEIKLKYAKSEKDAFEIRLKDTEAKYSSLLNTSNSNIASIKDLTLKINSKDTELVNLKSNNVKLLSDIDNLNKNVAIKEADLSKKYDLMNTELKQKALLIDANNKYFADMFGLLRSLDVKLSEIVRERQAWNEETCFNNLSYYVIALRSSMNIIYSSCSGDATAKANQLKVLKSVFDNADKSFYELLDKISSLDCKNINFEYSVDNKQSVRDIVRFMYDNFNKRMNSFPEEIYYGINKDEFLIS